jgi:hypothetical protein
MRLAIVYIVTAERDMACPQHPCGRGFLPQQRRSGNGAERRISRDTSAAGRSHSLSVTGTLAHRVPDRRLGAADRSAGRGHICVQNVLYCALLGVTCSLTARSPTPKASPDAPSRPKRSCPPTYRSATRHPGTGH